MLSFDGVFVQNEAIQHRDEARWIFDKVSEKRPSKVLEIGVAGGGTIKMWCAAAAPGALVVGIDTFTDPYRDKVIERCAPVVQANSIDLRFVQADSTGVDALAGWDLGPWDFVHIDGHHGYQYVNSDFRRALERLAPGGFIAFHDAFDAGCADVGRTIKEAENEGLRVERFWAGPGDYPELGIKAADTRLGYAIVSRNE